MSRGTRRLLYGAVALLLGATASLALAGGEPPQVENVRLEPVWGGVKRLSARVVTGRGAITGAQYRVGSEVGPLFAVDGLLDSRDEQVESYVDLGSGAHPVEVRVRAAGTWSNWLRVAAPGGGESGRQGCSLTAAEPAQQGWFRGPVTVDCSALLDAPGAEQVAFSVGFGDWQESDGRLTLEQEGTHWVQVQTRDGDGVGGLPESLPVAIDSTAPTVWLRAPRTRVLSHADTLRLDFGADDQLSGVDLVVAELNGEQEIAAGAAVELWQLPLGAHQLSVRARDRAGNEAFLEQPVELTIAVDLPGMSRLVQMLGARGKIDPAARQQLNGHLAAAAAAQGEGDTLTARLELQLFLEAVMDGLAQRQIFEDAGEVLVSDAYALVDSLEDDPASGPPDWAGQ